MSGKDKHIKEVLETIIEKDNIGKNLKGYFSSISERDMRRAIFILSNIYPDKINMSDSEFEFIIYMFSNIKIIQQDNFFEFVRAVNVIDFSDRQKNVLKKIIKEHLEALCEKCIFELDSLIIKVFEPTELIEYISNNIANSTSSLMQHFESILRDKSLSHNNNAKNELKLLKAKLNL